MSSNLDYVEFVCEQIRGDWTIRYRKMFGEYMIYIDDKPILLLCDNIVFVKIIEQLKDVMENAQIGVPYNGANQHYILDVENTELSHKVIDILLQNLTFNKKRKQN